MNRTTWAEVEEGLRDDTFEAFYQIELRKALLDSNKLPELGERLEQEINELEERFREVGALYLSARGHADRERQVKAQAKANSADFPQKNAKPRRKRPGAGA